MVRQREVAVLDVELGYRSQDRQVARFHLHIKLGAGHAGADDWADGDVAGEFVGFDGARATIAAGASGGATFGVGERDERGGGRGLVLSPGVQEPPCFG